MHGGTQHSGWVAGRGFVASSAMSEPEPPESIEETPAGTATTPSREAWAQAHAGLQSDYEARLAAHDTDVARFERSQGRRSDWHQVQRQQAIATGSLGYARFYRGRTELSGTPTYNRNWLGDLTTRPALHEGVGPYGGDRVANLVERRTSQRVLANRGAELEAEGNLLGMVRPGGDDAAEPSPSSSTTPTLSGEAVPWPRSAGWAPKGQQFSNISFESLRE